MLCATLISKWQKTWVVCKASLDAEENDYKEKKLDLGKNMMKVKLPLLDGKGKYLQFAMAYQEQTKDFTNELAQFEGDKNKLLQLVKDAMCDKEDKKILGVTYSLDSAVPSIISILDIIPMGIYLTVPSHILTNSQ